MKLLPSAHDRKKTVEKFKYSIYYSDNFLSLVLIADYLKGW